MSRRETVFPATQEIPGLSVVFGKHKSQKQYLPLAAKPGRPDRFSCRGQGQVDLSWQNGTTDFPSVLLSSSGRVQGADEVKDNLLLYGRICHIQSKPPGRSSSAATRLLRGATGCCKLAEKITLNSIWQWIPLREEAKCYLFQNFTKSTNIGENWSPGSQHLMSRFSRQHSKEKVSIGLMVSACNFSSQGLQQRLSTNLRLACATAYLCSLGYRVGPCLKYPKNKRAEIVRTVTLVLFILCVFFSWQVRISLYFLQISREPRDYFNSYSGKLRGSQASHLQFGD